jgi:hypothetical protein
VQVAEHKNLYAAPLHIAFMQDSRFVKALDQAIARFEGVPDLLRFFGEWNATYLRMRFIEGRSLTCVARHLHMTLRTLPSVMRQAHYMVYQYLTWSSMDLAQFFERAYGLPFPR